MPEHGSARRAAKDNPVLFAIGVIGALFPILLVAYVVVHEFLPEPEPDTPAGWVAWLDGTDPDERDRAAAALRRLAADEPERVIEALIASLREHAAEARGPDGPAGDVRLRLAASDGEGTETPPLPIGIWIFGERTLVEAGERLELKVVPVEAWQAFAAEHAGRVLIVEVDGEVAARHRLGPEEGDTLVLEPAGPPERLAQVFTHHRFFRRAETEAGKVLASLGDEVRPALRALAAEGVAEAHVAAWAWWRLDRNRAQGAEGRYPLGFDSR